MKTNKYLFGSLFALGLFAGACAEDDGNYSYTKLNEVTISDIENKYTVEAGGRLHIEPTITSLDENSADLSYLWTVEEQTLSTERVLDVALPPLSNGGHLCALTITDNVSKMQYRQTFELNIVSTFNFGYYFLTRRDDGSTELAYIQAVKDAVPTMDDVKYTTGCGDYGFGNEPQAIVGNFKRFEAQNTYAWEMIFMTREGDYPTIVTNNMDFQPNYLITNESFVDQTQGYAFKPEKALVSQSGDQFFLSEGKFISYKSGKLYRPARHDKDYYWSNAAFGSKTMGLSVFSWVYDKNSRQIFAIKPYQQDNPEAGIYADPLAYDQVLVPENNPVIEGNVFYMTDIYNNNSMLYAYSSAPDGIHVYTFQKVWAEDNTSFTNETVLPLEGIGENPPFAIGMVGAANGMWFVGNGLDIYTSPTMAPSLTKFMTIPAEYASLGKIQTIGLSAVSKRMVVVLYDENSPEERKGSVLFIDYNNKTVEASYPNILYPCISYFGGNGSNSTFNNGFGDDL